MTGPKRPPPVPPHPFGKTRKERVEQWRSRSVFGDPADPMTEIARRVVLAADAANDADMQRLALQALGLDGDKATANNVQALRDAIDELGRIADDGRLDEVLNEGVPAWLYRRTRGTTAGSTDTALKFLRRVAARDPGSRSALEWALSLWKAHRAPPTHSRGRVR